MALMCRWRSRPQHHNRTHAIQQTPGYAITAAADSDQRRSHVNAERPCGLQIDGEFKFDRPCNRHVGWLRALENLAGMDINLSKQARDGRLRGSSARRPPHHHGPHKTPERKYVAQHVNEPPPMRGQTASHDASKTQASIPVTLHLDLQPTAPGPACGSGQLRVRATDIAASPTCRRTGTESLAFPAARTAPGRFQ